MLTVPFAIYGRTQANFLKETQKQCSRGYSGDELDPGNRILVFKQKINRYQRKVHALKPWVIRNTINNVVDWTVENKGHITYLIVL